MFLLVIVPENVETEVHETLVISVGTEVIYIRLLNIKELVIEVQSMALSLLTICKVD